VHPDVQGQPMRRKGEDDVGKYDVAFSLVPAASRFRTILSLATLTQFSDMFTDHVENSQAFVQGGLPLGDSHNLNGKVYMSPPPGCDKDPHHAYRLLKPLYGMPSVARAWHTYYIERLARKGRMCNGGLQKEHLHRHYRWHSHPAKC